MMTLLEQPGALFDLARDRLLAGNGLGRMFVPATDLVVGEDEVTVHMDVPGLRPENLDIELTGEVLVVRGERTRPQFAEGRGARTWYRFERGFGRFQRILQVPKGLDPDSITAEIADGVLTLHIPQPEARRPRKIEISTPTAQPSLETELETMLESAEAAPADGERSETTELAGAAA
jgi:HSP20 family protein